MPTADIGDGVLLTDTTINSGTGHYNSFLRVQNDGEETGYNTDDNNRLNNKDGIWTHALLLSSLDTVTIGSTTYYEIRLDLNETNSKTGPNISLDDLQIFWGSAAVSGDEVVGGLSGSGLHKVFDLGGSQPLVDHNHGSGTDDYQFLIPVDLFAGATAGSYLTLYADFSGADGGFEEFRVRSADVGDGLPAITVVKDVAPTIVDEGTVSSVTYTYTLTSQSSATDPLTVTSFIDDNGTPGALHAGDDVDLLTGASGTNLGIYYVSGDDNHDGLLQNTEAWVFSYTRNDVLLNADETLVNVATVNAVDDEGNNASSHDDATVTGQDVLPDINIVKDASVSLVQAGTPTDVTFTYTITNTSTTSLDPLTLTGLKDDMGTAATGDDVDLLALIAANDPNVTFTGDGGDGILQKGETWTITFTTSVDLMPGETRTNIVTVDGHDDEGDLVHDTDDASVTAYNLGRTPGFWSNNGSKLWDGDTGTFPKAGGLGIVQPGHDLMYNIFDTNGDGTVDHASGITGYLMIGDWHNLGYADGDENVLVISRRRSQDARRLPEAAAGRPLDGGAGRDRVMAQLSRRFLCRRRQRSQQRAPLYRRGGCLAGADHQRS